MIPNASHLLMNRLKANTEVKAATQKMLFRFLHLHSHKNLFNNEMKSKTLLNLNIKEINVFCKASIVQFFLLLVTWMNIKYIISDNILHILRIEYYLAIVNIYLSHFKT